MIYLYTREVRENLARRRYPYHRSIEFGPERLKREGTVHNAIVVMHDEDSGDAFAATSAPQRNPRRIRERWVGVRVLVYATSGKSGAGRHDHIEEAEKVLDLIITATEEVVVGSGQFYRLTGGRFLRPEELAAEQLPETPSGVVYQLQLSIARAVLAVDYAGDALDTFTTTADNVETTEVNVAQHPALS